MQYRIVNRFAIGTIAICVLSMTGIPAYGQNIGCCDSIASSSICLDYSGSYWASNPAAMALNCKGMVDEDEVMMDDTLFRPEHCLGPLAEKYLIGSCIYGQFLPFETISHHFAIGNGGYDAPDFDFDWLRISCEGTGNVWVWGFASGQSTIQIE